MDEKDRTTQKLRDMQHQIRKNTLDTQSYLADLQEWEKDIRQKDAALLTTPANSATKFPLRNTPTLATNPGESRRKKKCQKKEKPKPTTIKSHDYTAWDKFDADKACEDVDYAVQSEDDERCGSECECDQSAKTDQEIEKKARTKRAEFEKSKGNELFAKGKYEEAIGCYTLALSFDHGNAVYYANRAMAALKLKRFVKAEEDCTKALNLDPTYIKAYHRRATARLSLKNISGAREDFIRLLSLEPNNQDAKEKLAIITEWEAKHLPKPTETTASMETSTRTPSSKPALIPKSRSTETVRPEIDGNGRTRVFPLPTPFISVPEKPLRRVNVTDANSASKQEPINIPKAPPSKASQREISATANPTVDVVRQTLPSVSAENPTSNHQGGKDVLPTAVSGRSFGDACVGLFKSKSSSDCADFLQKINVKSLGQLVGQNLSPEIIYTIVNGAIELSNRSPLTAAAGVDYLDALSQLPRFKFFVHGLSYVQKSAVRECLEKCAAAPGSEAASVEILAFGCFFRPLFRNPTRRQPRRTPRCLSNFPRARRFLLPRTQITSCLNPDIACLFTLIGLDYAASAPSDVRAGRPPLRTSPLALHRHTASSFIKFLSLFAVLK
ncbi:putative RNA polymerase II-associated protein 3 [Hypsibius exemplaris]|uniref:RNA polymerase II-associated protein 3 n=1 Tax=Hypsibius exemplaris TaxID=2072580 RepID=A0A9X6N9H7_HYPEX|nr:putative RNA polymerase II-associated protein 3 [Hypsibius exemplaris]